MRRLAFVALAGLVLTEARTGADNWAQWRGPGGQGISTEAGLPTEWSPEKNVAWKTPLPGQGHSSPVVWGRRAFLTAAIEGGAAPEGHKAPTHIMEGQVFVHPDSVGVDKVHTLKVLALDVETGRILWDRTAYEGPVFDARHKRSSFAAPTPVTDGRFVFAYFGPEGVYCYDLEGQLKWKASVGKFPLFGMGTGTSPVLYRNLLILQRDENNGEQSFITALDTATGKEVWRTPRAVEASWATPVVVETGARTELVTAGNQFIIAYDPATGKELWRTKGLESNAIHTPLVGHGLVVATAGYPAKKVIAVRPGGSGDVTGTDRVVWQYDKGTGYVISNLLYGDYVYLVSDKGIVTCLDAKTGAVKYEGGRVPVPATFMASPVAYDGKILLTSIEGDTHVIKAGPTFEVLRSNAIGEAAMATPALSQGRILLRGQTNLYCVR